RSLPSMFVVERRIVGGVLDGVQIDDSDGIPEVIIRVATEVVDMSIEVNKKNAAHVHAAEAPSCRVGLSLVGARTRLLAVGVERGTSGSERPHHEIVARVAAHRPGAVFAALSGIKTWIRDKTDSLADSDHVAGAVSDLLQFHLRVLVEGA